MRRVAAALVTLAVGAAAADTIRVGLTGVEMTAAPGRTDLAEAQD